MQLGMIFYVNQRSEELFSILSTLESWIADVAQKLRKILNLEIFVEYLNISECFQGSKNIFTNMFKNKGFQSFLPVRLMFQRERVAVSAHVNQVLCWFRRIEGIRWYARRWVIISSAFWAKYLRCRTGQWPDWKDEN